MRTPIYRLFGATLFVSAAACGGTPADYEGADNTHSQTVANACAQLNNCCFALADEERAGCLSTASSGDEASCSNALQGATAICQ